MPKQNNALTVGEISRRIGCPIHKVEYLIRSRGIKPINVQGTLEFSLKNATNFFIKK